MIMSSKQDLRTGVRRPNTPCIPNIPLPFYPRSAGYSVVNEGIINDIPANVNNFNQIFWFAAGEGKIILEGKLYTIRGGQSAIRKRNAPQYLRVVNGPLIFRWLTFDGPSADDFLSSYMLPERPLKSGRCPHQLFIDYEECLRDSKPFSFRKAVTIVVDVFAHMCENMHEPNNYNSMLNGALEFCRANFHNSQLNVNEIAQYLNVHRSTLQRVFKDALGMAPSKYIMDLRIKKAISLLNESNLSISEISNECGFSTQNYFTRIIKEKTGKPPQIFRYPNNNNKISNKKEM